MADYSIQMGATLDAIAAERNGTTVTLVLDSYVGPEDVADLYRMRGKQVAVQIVDPDQPLPLDYGDGDEGAPAPEDGALAVVD